MVPILLLLPCLSLGYQDCRPLNRNDDIGPFPLVCDLWISVCQKGFAQEETPSRTTLAPEDELSDPKQFAILKGQVGLNWQDFWALMYFQFSPSHFYHFCQSNLCSGSWPRLRWNWRSYCGGVVCWGKRGRRWKLQIQKNTHCSLPSCLHLPHRGNDEVRLFQPLVFQISLWQAKRWIMLQSRSSAVVQRQDQDRQWWKVILGISTEWRKYLQVWVQSNLSKVIRTQDHSTLSFQGWFECFFAGVVCA